jgi:hypothetical protein
LFEDTNNSKEAEAAMVETIAAAAVYLVLIDYDWKFTSPCLLC